MSRPTRATHPFYNLLPVEVEGFDALAALALDMRWSWNHAADDVWQQLDPALWWELTHTPGWSYKRSRGTRPSGYLPIPFSTSDSMTWYKPSGRRLNERSDPDHDVVFGCRRRAADERMGS